MNIVREPITYQIKDGDNLYMLAMQFKTSVPIILSENPGIDPYNLQVGSNIIIIPGEDYMGTAIAQNKDNCEKEIALIDQMRLVWSQHVYWTRMLLVSMADRMRDQNYVTNRLLMNPDDTARIFGQYYSTETAEAISQLLTEHLVIAADLVAALRDGRSNDAYTLNARWYKNADQMAEAFAGINPYYEMKEVQEMLYHYLDLTKQEVSYRLNKNYPEDIKAFDMIEKEALEMADYFSQGIMEQFPQKF